MSAFSRTNMNDIGSGIVSLLVHCIYEALRCHTVNLSPSFERFKEGNHVKVFILRCRSLSDFGNGGLK